MSSNTQNLQDTFINHLRTSKAPVTVFLVNGVKLQGVITWFDTYTLLLRREEHTQLVFKHAISTILPIEPVVLQRDKADVSEVSSTDARSVVEETLASPARARKAS